MDKLEAVGSMRQGDAGGTWRTGLANASQPLQAKRFQVPWPSLHHASITFFNRSNHHEQEPGQQESSEERTRQEPQGKKGSEEGKEGSQQAAMMR